MKEEIQTQILECADNSSLARIYFRSATRIPVFGKFVMCEDFSELFKKGMVRFVMNDRIETFDKFNNLNLTRIYVMDEINMIKTF